MRWCLDKNTGRSCNLKFTIPQMSVIMWNKNIPNNGVKEVRSSCEGLSPCSLGILGQVPGSRNQAPTNITPLNADNEDNAMVLEE